MLVGLDFFLIFLRLICVDFFVIDVWCVGCCGEVLVLLCVVC